MTYCVLCFTDSQTHIENQHDRLVRSAEALGWPLDKVALVLAGYSWDTEDDIKLAKDKGYGVIEDNCTELSISLPSRLSVCVSVVSYQPDLTDIIRG